MPLGQIQEERDKITRLTVTAFGCNRKAQKELKEFFETHLENQTFYFYEYFCLDPIAMGQRTGKIRLIAPFLERILARSSFVPDPDQLSYLKKQFEKGSFFSQHDRIRFKPNNLRVVSKIRESFLMTPIQDMERSTTVGRRIYESWKTNREVDTLHDRDCQFSSLKIRSNEGETRICDRGYFLLTYLRNKYLPLSFSKPIPSTDKFHILLEFLTVVCPWLPVEPQPSNHKLHYLAIPISSKNIFFGYFILFHMVEQEDDPTEKLAGILCRIADSTYRPVLTLFENYWEESLLRDKFEDIKNWDACDVLFKDDSGLRLSFLAKELQHSRDLLEEPLHRLWSKRADEWKNERRERVRESFIFCDFIVASPGMVGQVQRAMNLKLSKSGKALPSAMVIGGPGAGKESMSRLISLFAEDYAFKDVYTINMASIKPDAIATPLIRGVELDPIGIKIVGLFEQALVGQAEPATFVLDELNSLDIDSQGALLRFLENSEILPLGKITRREEKLKPERVNLLIIGVMNEDPENLTKQSVIEQILRQNKLLGGMLGELLYEYFRKLRRLRDDLYYRMVRGGKIVIPPLEERAEDIPILFYFIAKEDVGDRRIYVDFGVYDILMSEMAKWPGNVRQLQSVVKRTVTEAQREAKEETVEIYKKHVEKVLKEFGILEQ